MMLATQEAHGQDEKHRVPSGANDLVNHDFSDGVGDVQCWLRGGRVWVAWLYFVLGGCILRACAREGCLQVVLPDIVQWRRDEAAGGELHQGLSVEFKGDLWRG